MIADALREHVCAHLQVALDEDTPHRTRARPVRRELHALRVDGGVQRRDAVLLIYNCTPPRGKESVISVL